MTAAVGKTKACVAAEAKTAGRKGKSQIVAKLQQAKVRCDPCDRTTLIFRKLPKDVTRASLLEMLDAAGSKGLYDFVYLPMDFKKGKVCGYAIVNFVANAWAEQARFHFEGEGVDLDWSDSHQGLDDLIQRYRDSPIMHTSMPETSKPIIFRNGAVAAFPCPTKMVETLSKN